MIPTELIEQVERLEQAIARRYVTRTGDRREAERRGSERRS